MKTNIKKRGAIYQAALIFAFLLISLFRPAYAQGASGVLVAAESSQVQKTSTLEIRRIYLGLPSSSDSLIKKPIVNLSNHEIYKEFLKNIMHMTEKGYQRKLIKRIFRQGGEKIIEEENITNLVDHLEKNPDDVSFMDGDTAKRTKGIKVVQILW
jgi:hypothetical protein